MTLPVIQMGCGDKYVANGTGCPVAEMPQVAEAVAALTGQGGSQ